MANDEQNKLLRSTTEFKSKTRPLNPSMKKEKRRHNE